MVTNQHGDSHVRGLMSMPNNRISPDLLSTSGGEHTAFARPSVLARVTARLRAYRLDRQLAVGVPAPAGSPVAVHAARLTSVAERQSIARTLRRVVHHAHCG